MKKLIYIPISAVIILFYLQALWIRNMHQNYCVQLTQSIDRAITSSIIKGLELRTYSPYKNPNNPKLIYKHAEEMSSEERKRLKGDTINLDMLAKKNISTNIAEAIMQIQQDICINKKQFIQMARLDSIFKKRLYDIKIKYCILLYDKDTTIIQKAGDILPLDDHKIKETKLYPLGTRCLQFIQVKAIIPLTSFLTDMFLIIIESILLTIIILGYVIFLVITIHKKDKLFKRREASVNGTIHDLKSPLNSIITLMSFIKKCRY